MSQLPERKANRLINEKSPYLLQHAHNPVEWYAWGEEAFGRARSENKPIFLSIGYSTCHWCHVMERESFEDEKIANLMNKYFVSIKVDREERPDVDKVYMTAVQLMTGSGGWPLSVFLTPELKPFYGGTYFPPRDLYGRPGFPTVLERIHQMWESEHGKVLESGDQLIEYLRQRPDEPAPSGAPDESVLHKTFHQFASEYDPKYGGFGGGPKFPRPVVLNFLFRYHAHTRNTEALQMGLTTLQNMARGGMYDQIGGGFHRYSVDGQWRVPHFEKMLYDQAQLVYSYLDAYQITRDKQYSLIAAETLNYILRDLTDPGGGFYSAEDADSPEPENPSQKSEGAFYLWRKSEIDRLLGADDARVFCHHFGVDEEGNAFSDPQGEFRKKNILYQPFTIAQTASFFSFSESQVSARIAEDKRRLFTARSERARPARDDKILTSWNGLAIGALARAGRILGDPRYTEAAISAAEFVFARLYDASAKTLQRRYRQGESKFEAHLDDYAFLIAGLLELYETTFSPRWLKLALDLHATQVSLFWDSSEGGFFDFSGKDSSILVRSKEAYDGAEPTGNSIAAMNLIRLSQLTDDPLIKKNGEKTLRLWSARLQESPRVMPQMIVAIGFSLVPARQIVIAGPPDHEATRGFLRRISDRFIPNVLVLLADGGENQAFASERLPSLASMTPVNGAPAAYVCENYTCKLPLTDITAFEQALDEFSSP